MFVFIQVLAYFLIVQMDKLFCYLHFFVAMQKWFSSAHPNKMQTKQNLLSLLNTLNSVMLEKNSQMLSVSAVVNSKVTAIVRFFGGVLNTQFSTLEKNV